MDVKLEKSKAHDVEVLIDTLWLAQYKPMIMMLAYAVIFMIQLLLTFVLWPLDHKNIKHGLYCIIQGSGLYSDLRISTAGICGSCYRHGSF